MRVLLMDDRSDILVSYSRSLKKLGFEPVTCKYVNHAVEILLSNDLDCSIAVLDMKIGIKSEKDIMKNNGGSIVLRSIYPERYCVPGIILTAYDSIESFAETTEAGAFSYIKKADKTDKFKAVLRRAVIERVRRVRENLTAKLIHLLVVNGNEFFHKYLMSIDKGPDMSPEEYQKIKSYFNNSKHYSHLDILPVDKTHEIDPKVIIERMEPEDSKLDGNLTKKQKVLLSSDDYLPSPIPLLKDLCNSEDSVDYQFTVDESNKNWVRINIQGQLEVTQERVERANSLLHALDRKPVQEGEIEVVMYGLLLTSFLGTASVSLIKGSLPQIRVEIPTSEYLFPSKGDNPI